MQTETVTAKKGRSKKPTLNGECEHHDKGINPSAPLNASGIHPFEFKVLVLPDEYQNVKRWTGTDGQTYELALPDEHVDMEKRAVYRGTLIALSPTAFSYESWPAGTVLPKPGDKVLYGKYAGTNVKGPKDGKEYRVLNDKDIIALLDA
jgi:co-chaperonin GroES (HSP10)